MSGEENPYYDHLDEIEDYCEKCCENCPPSEMCPGCDCSDYCVDEEEEHAWDEWEEYTWPDICGVDSELDPLCYTEEEDEW